ncbi:aquaporin [Lysobacter korlensis]|uniref:Aquaporin n=1 Tax=Lysobacter korlensis TaxID=553636 RepID=A0ABV6RY70_9GAMM
MIAVPPARLRRVSAEFLGSGSLTMVVVGSGIAAERLSPDDVGLQLLENAIATALGLFVLIAVLAPVSGAHFNPVVSFVDAALGYRSWRSILPYLPAQVLGCVGGAVLANAMFGLAPITVSSTARVSGPNLLSELVATAGLVLVIFSLARSGRAGWAPAAVGAYIGAAYFFTASTSFANPAITVGRMFSDTFAGIHPASAPGFIAAQLAGGLFGLLLVRLLFPRRLPSERR